MEYEVRIDQFEGPLDLLLHLIKENKMDLFDIQIEVITDQYLSYIQSMERLNLNVASEYLVMASELIEMKSRLLLPRNDVSSDEVEEEDPKEALVQRLIEYQRYKDITEGLKELESMRQEFYTKLPENLTEYADENTVLSTDVTLDDLVTAFEHFLKQKQLEKPIETKVTRREITIEERRKSIRNILKEKKRVSFFELFDVLTKEYVVVTFLTILEMAKAHQLTIEQEGNFESIYCCQKEVEA